MLIPQGKEQLFFPIGSVGVTVLASGQGHLKVYPAGASSGEAGGAMLSHRAAPTHAKGLCVPRGWTPAIGPVMNITQEDPTLVQGQALP